MREAWCELATLEQTTAVGQQLGQAAFPNAVFGLLGPLGAGKTSLVQAVAKGLEVPDPLAVVSPTFVLVQEYHGRLPLYHIDVYRLTSSAQFLELGVQELMEAGGVTCIEWADRVLPWLPRSRLLLTLSVDTGQIRRLHLQASGNAYEQLLTRLTLPRVSSSL
jgi:tRNA threonylcarbamoyladenosine biosynthesis protein TsaE